MDDRWLGESNFVSLPKCCLLVLTAYVTTPNCSLPHPPFKPRLWSWSCFWKCNFTMSIIQLLALIERGLIYIYMSTFHGVLLNFVFLGWFPTASEQHRAYDIETPHTTHEDGEGVRVQHGLDLQYDLDARKQKHKVCHLLRKIPTLIVWLLFNL